MLRRDQVPVLAPDDRLTDVVDEFGDNDINRALVLEDDRLAGLLSITNVAHALKLGRCRG
jgi:CBS domain-containing protein